MGINLIAILGYSERNNGLVNLNMDGQEIKRIEW